MYKLMLANIETNKWMLSITVGQRKHFRDLDHCEPRKEALPRPPVALLEGRFRSDPQCKRLPPRLRPVPGNQSMPLGGIRSSDGEKPDRLIGGVREV